MKKLVIALCLLTLALGGAQTALAESYNLCPGYFDTSKSGAENMVLMAAQNPGQLRQVGVGGIDLSEFWSEKFWLLGSGPYMSMIGHYKSSGPDNLEVMLASAGGSLLPSVDIYGLPYYSTISGLTENTKLALVTYDNLTDSGTFKNYSFQTLLAMGSASVWRVNDEIVYQPENPYGGSTPQGLRLSKYEEISERGDPLFFVVPYLISIDLDVDGVQQTFLFSVYGYAELPIPGAVWLMGTGLAGLAVMRRKGKKA